MRTIAVFGGSGNTGREVISAALRRGIQIRALYRPGTQPTPVQAGLIAIEGQLTNEADVRRTLEGTEGAVLVFGPRLSRKVKGDVFCAAATRNVVAGMKALRLERIVCQTGAMAGGDSPNWSWAVRRFVRRYRRLFPAVAADRDEQEAVVTSSGLDWTVVRPFRISGAKGKGRVRVTTSVRIGLFTRVRRPDLAEFLVDEATLGTHHRQIVYAVT